LGVRVPPLLPINALVCLVSLFFMGHSWDIKK
jgi:hypothetical protein